MQEKRVTQQQILWLGHQLNLDEFANLGKQRINEF